LGCYISRIPWHRTYSRLASCLVEAVGVAGRDLFGERPALRDLLNAKETVRHTESELRDFIATIPAAVWSTLPDGVNVFTSRHWSDYTGRSSDEGADWAWADALHPEDRPTFIEKWRAALASGEPFEAEARVQRADGQYRWFMARGVQCVTTLDA